MRYEDVMSGDVSNDLDGGSHNLFVGIIPVYAWKYLGKL
jgi:hypothetical protein